MYRTSMYTPHFPLVFSLFFQINLNEPKRQDSIKYNKVNVRYYWRRYAKYINTLKFVFVSLILKSVLKQSNLECSRDKYAVYTHAYPCKGSQCQNIKTCLSINITKGAYQIVKDIKTNENKENLPWCKTKQENTSLKNKRTEYYSRLSLSRSPRDSLEYFEISVPWHIRFAEVKKK